MKVLEIILIILAGTELINIIISLISNISSINELKNQRKLAKEAVQVQEKNLKFQEKQLTMNNSISKLTKKYSDELAMIIANEKSFDATLNTQQALLTHYGNRILELENKYKEKGGVDD